MSLMSQLEFALDFSNTEKEIAKYILSHEEKILDYSIQELSKKTYSSPATIVRLCKKLGTEGYGDFKIKYSAELQTDKKIERVDVNFPFSTHNTKIEIARSLASLHEEAIYDTLSLLNEQLLENITDKLARANHIFVFGSGNSILAALNFQHKMLRIGKHVELRTIEGEQPFLAYSAQNDDIAIIISYSGETESLIHIAKILKHKKIELIAITTLGENRLSQLCDDIIHIQSREKIFNKIAPFASKISMEYVLDVLYSTLFQRHYNTYLDSKLNNDGMYDHRHPSNSPINEETK